MPNRLQINYVDEDGDKASHGAYITEAVGDPANALVQTLVAAIGAVSHAAIPSMKVLNDLASTDTAIANPYDAEDKAMFIFEDTLGNKTKMLLPAPLRLGAGSEVDVFKADDDTVDAGNTLVGELLTEIMLVIIAKGGEILIKHIRGKRTRKNRKS